jgi:polyisoprenoid-binding protein YceI
LTEQVFGAGEAGFLFDNQQRRTNLKIKLTAAVLAAAVSIPAFALDSYTIDPQHSFPGFEVNHLGFSNMHGSFLSTSGKIMLDPAGKAGSIDATIDLSSVTTGLAKRDDHLRSPDFFDVAKYPTMTYKSTKLKYNGSDLAGADGELTLHGVTKPVSLTLTNFRCGANPISKKPTCGGNATASIKRSDFGITTGVPAVSDEVKITIEVEAIKD